MPAPRKSLYSSLASTSSHAQLPNALLEWVRSLPSTTKFLSSSSSSDGDDDQHKVDTLDHLMDGVVLGQVLLDIDSTHFNPLAAALSNSKALRENWVLRFNNLKRLYKLLIRYFEDVLSSSTTELSTPNLQLVAKNEPGACDEVCKLVGLVLALAVQSEQRLQHIERIQSLEEWVQRELMYSIETVMSKVETVQDRDKTVEIDADTEFYQIQHEKSRLIHDKESLQLEYSQLVQQFETLKEEHEEALASAAAAESRAVEAEKREKEKASGNKTEQGLKQEIDRLRSELQTTSNQLGESEQTLSTQSLELVELSRKVEDLSRVALEATRLKDQVDEYKHVVEKHKKLENVLEKYKKKVEESGEWKKMIKTLEDENTDLSDKNSQLVEENSKLSSFKHLNDSYKTQVANLESKHTRQLKEVEKLKSLVEIEKEKSKIVEEERTRERERVAALEERIREFELSERRGTTTKREGEEEEDEEFQGGVGGELNDALSGTTTTDLKLRIRKLERQLASVNSTNSNDEREGTNRATILENLLEDANRMKERYEGEYLKETRKRISLERKLEDISNARSKSGDGPEANAALRVRLEGKVVDLETARKRLVELETSFKALERELSIAKQDLNLVDKDRLEIVQSLRSSLADEKNSLSIELAQTSTLLSSAQEEARMHREEVEGLLRDKIELQGDGIDQRNRILEEFGSSSKDQAKLIKIETEKSNLETQVQTLQETIQKMKAYIKSQDKTVRAELSANYEETLQSNLSQISQLKEDLSRQKSMSAELETNYRREHELILSAWHDNAMRHLRTQVLASTGGANGNGREREYQPQSWIAQQRARANGKSLRTA